ncbi:FAD:protein FMN transferase [Tropicimonas sp.]|uniref:FAD:protein FMN transferase n=1 Tax=Tropicimonas sp. TaxID=2067044 RepID=UPI003A853704
MTLPLSRRRFLCISAAICATPALASGGGATWQGMALGAPASIRLEGVSPAAAQPVFSAVEAELSHLEGIFSLFRPGSSLAALNRDGQLTAPPAELLEVLSLCDTLHRESAGAFDPTVQVLWHAHAEAATKGRQVTPAEREAALERTGWQHLRFDAGAIGFDRPGMALTLNGIAQGYITDRIARLLARRGFGNTVVDMGEVLATGHKTGGEPWVAGIAGNDGTILHRITLTDRALATSSPLGTVLDPQGRIGHIIDPRSGDPAGDRTLVSVSAPDAALADGLSTACCLVEADRAGAIVAQFPDAKVEALV